ncbi:MAG TPA: hypothetical protein VIK26_01150 [Clostridium sp.]
MYYHGSSVKGLKTLLPYLSDHKQPYIYFATNPVVAVFYMIHIVERPYNWFTYGFSESGIPTYTEYYPNAMADVYSGKTGYLYECSKVDNIQNPTNINCAYVCETPMLIDKCTVFKNIYENFLEYEKQGKLIIQRYETLSLKKLSFINKVVQSEITDNNLKSNPNVDYSLFLKKHFPETWNNTK